MLVTTIKVRVAELPTLANCCYRCDEKIHAGGAGELVWVMRSVWSIWLARS